MYGQWVQFNNKQGIKSSRPASPQDINPYTLTSNQKDMYEFLSQVATKEIADACKRCNADVVFRACDLLIKLRSGVYTEAFTIVRPKFEESMTVWMEWNETENCFVISATNLSHDGFVSANRLFRRFTPPTNEKTGLDAKKVFLTVGEFLSAMIDLQTNECEKMDKDIFVYKVKMYPPVLELEQGKRSYDHARRGSTMVKLGEVTFSYNELMNIRNDANLVLFFQ